MPPLDVVPLDLPEVKLIRVRRHGDNRGYFVETYNRQAMAAVGISHEFVQDNLSFSADVGTVRGLHFQTPPFAQHKLVRVARGRILDVAVDVRRSSPTFGRHVVQELSAASGDQLLVPIGFAHGLVTLEPDTEVAYKVTSHYSPAHDKGIIWNDPALAIQWPIDAASAVLSAKDQALPRLAEAIVFD